jgi:hypothetical protein
MPIGASILSKKENYRLWRRGCYGNMLRSWTVDEWQKVKFQNKVAVRTLLCGGGGPCIYNLEPDQAESEIIKLRKSGIAADQIMINEMAPNNQIIIQGEFFNGILVIDEVTYWNHFFYSYMKLPMRAALKYAGLTIANLQAHLLLKSCMTPASWEDWNLLCDQYPDHVLEVSIYDCCLGDLPNRNTLVWEIRKY